MPSWRHVLSSVAAAAVAAAVVVTVSVTPFAVAASSTSVEGETMTVAPASAVNRIADATASAGSSLVLKVTATAATKVTLPASTSVVVRAKGVQCAGAPIMTVAVDGKSIAKATVSATSWTNYPVPTTIPAGSHTISVAYTNPFWFLCLRSLALDTVTIVPAVTTTTTTSSPTTTTSPSTTTNPTTTTTSTVPATTTTPSTTTTIPPIAGDSTAQLQAQFDALTPGQAVKLSPGTYQHRGVLKIRAAGVQIDGNGATLQALNDATSSVQVTADGVSLKNLNLTAPLTGSRYSTPDQHRLYIAAKNATVTDVNITGSAASGVFVNGASNFNLTRVTVKQTRADGIHITGGSSNGQVNNAATQATGDDGIAVVSYGGDPRPCTGIIVTSPVVTGTTGGRGISVVGGNNISFRSITVSQSYAAGVYIATEGGDYNTSSVDTVDVTGGTVTGANTSTQVINGAVLVYSGYGSSTVRNVTISGLTIASTPTPAERNAGIIVDAGTVSGIKYTDIALRNTTLTPLVLAKVPAGSYTATGWTKDGVPINVP